MELRPTPSYTATQSMHTRRDMTLGTAYRKYAERAATYRTFLKRHHGDGIQQDR